MRPAAPLRRGFLFRVELRFVCSSAYPLVVMSALGRKRTLADVSYRPEADISIRCLASIIAPESRLCADPPNESLRFAASRVDACNAGKTSHGLSLCSVAVTTALP